MADAENLEDKFESANVFEIGAEEKASDASGEPTEELFSTPAAGQLKVQPLWETKRRRIAHRVQLELA